MKKSLRFFILLPIALLVLQTTLVAQVPQTFNYQGIARDVGGNVLPNRKIGVELSVLDGGPTGTVVYGETFTDTTNTFGLFSMQVGGGTVVSGSFSGINWATGNKYLQTSIDLSGGTSYTLSGTTQLLSVPYALYAGKAVVGVGNGSWNLNGNAGTGDTAFIGTTDNSSLFFKVKDSAAGSIVPASNETYLGYLSGKNAVGDIVNTTVGNTAVGSETLYDDNNGGYNAAFGYQALQHTRATNNTAVGALAMPNNVSGVSNTALGSTTMFTNVSGSENTVVGVAADVSTDGIFNSTAIGYEAIVNATNKVRIGNTNITVIEGQVPFTTPSDGRFKFNIRENVKGLDFILKLRPVTYQFNTKKQEDFVRGAKSGGGSAQGGGSAGALESGGTPVAYNEAMMIRRTGFIAQEVERAAKKSGYDFDGLKAPKTDKEYYTLSYASFVVPLVKAVQEQQETIDELRREVKELRQLIESNKTNKP